MHSTATLVREIIPHPALREQEVRASRRLPQERVAAEGMRGSGGLAEIEALMERLAGTSPTDVVGGIVCEHLATGGKRLRARLALATLEGLGGERKAGIAWAAACELLHNATLIHDDLQDGDQIRRGRPSVWARHGAGQAINAGDLLLMLPFLAVDELAAPREVRWSLARLLAAHATRVVRGQAVDLALSGMKELDWESYRAAVVGKTSALFQLPVEGAALLAGVGEEEAEALAAGFRPLGVLYQLQDDLLDLFGHDGDDLRGSDLRAGKVTALVVEHLARHPRDRAWLLALLACPRESTPETDVQRAMLRFRRGRTVEAVLARIDEEAQEALACPALHRWPALRALALELIEVVLAPIQHLRQEVKEGR